MLSKSALEYIRMLNVFCTFFVFSLNFEPSFIIFLTAAYRECAKNLSLLHWLKKFPSELKSKKKTLKKNSNLILLEKFRVPVISSTIVLQINSGRLVVNVESSIQICLTVLQSNGSFLEFFFAKKVRVRIIFSLPQILDNNIMKNHSKL